MAARKAKGYAELAKRELHRSHFPETNVPTFSVLVVTNGDYRCRTIGQELSKLLGPERWLMAKEIDLTPVSFLHGDVFINDLGEAGPLVKPATPANVS